MLDQSGGRPLREQSTATHTEIRVLLFGGSGVGKSMRNVQHDRMWLSHRLRQSGLQDLHGRQRVRLEPGHLQRWRHLRQHGRFVHLHLPTGTDTRRDGHSMHRSTEPCYLDYRHGICTKELEGHYLKSVCCCSIGKAWGHACDSCPKPGSSSFEELCPKGHGYVNRKDINECTTFSDMCDHGRCKNSIGSFNCRCNQGYALDEDGIKCNGEFELTFISYKVSENLIYSVLLVHLDIDECNIMRGVCGNGTCQNTNGSFTCDCEEGFESTMMMQICMGRFNQVLLWFVKW